MNAVGDIIMSSCANCGQGEEESCNLKTCTACKMVKYCNAACQEAHRSQHKKECRKRAAELHDEALFKPPPKHEDCPICFMRMPSLGSGHRYYTCCGNIVCNGCIYANKLTLGKHVCPFCRSPEHKSEEIHEQIKKLVEMGNAEAMYSLGCCYAEGKFGLPKDLGKAVELWHRAAELGYAKSYYNVGIAYLNGDSVRKDEIKAKYYCELAAMRGDVKARYNLGIFEMRGGNIDRALKHFMIAAGDGSELSLKQIKQLFMKGHATKKDYAKALRYHQAYLDEVRSDQRDAAAASDENNRYIE